MRASPSKVKVVDCPVCGRRHRTMVRLRGAVFAEGRATRATLSFVCPATGVVVLIRRRVASFKGVVIL